jgi:hypothetical protein
LGSGLTGPSVTVSAILKSGTNFFVSGSFTNAGGVTASNIARWDGSQWSALGGGVNKSVSALAVDGGMVYAGGQFSIAGGVTVTNVARWDGATWSNIGGLSAADPSAAATSYAYTLAIGPGGQLLAGGYFSVAGTRAAWCLAKWDGANWDAFGADLGEGLSSSSSAVYGLAAGTNALYAGG